MWNETAGNSISADEIRNEKSFFDFRIWEKQKLQTDQKYLWREGRVKPEVARMKARWRSSSRPGMICVFVELSLAEMLRQQQSEACLYHGQEVYKEMGWMFFSW